MRNPWRNIMLALLCAVFLCASLLADDADTPEENTADAGTVEQAEEIELDEGEAAEQGDKKSARDWISGRFIMDVDAAWSSRDSDIDLNQSLRLKISPPERPRLHFHGAVWMHQDLDGVESRNSTLFDLNSAYGKRFRTRLPELYMQVDDLWGNSTLRLGRQRIIDSPLYPRIDGAYFSQHNPQWDWYAYLGKRASLYTSAQDDFSAGAGVAWRPTGNTKLALDIAHLDENRRRSEIVRRGILPRLLGWRHPREVGGDVDTTYAALSLHQAITDNVWGYARITFHDDNPNEIFLDVLGHAPNMDLTYNFSYRRQMRRVTDQVNELTVFYRSLGRLETYDHFLATVHKQINPKLAISLEGELRNASGDARYSNNQDFWRLAGILLLTDIKPGWDFSVSLERWDVRRRSGAWIVTGEVAKRWEQWTWKAGVDYEQFRDELVEYDPRPQRMSWLAAALVPGIFPTTLSPAVRVLDTRNIRTREEIYGLYTSAEYRINENQRLRARVTFEDDNSKDAPFWRIRASYAIDF